MKITGEVAGGWSVFVKSLSSLSTHLTLPCKSHSTHPNTRRAREKSTSSSLFGLTLSLTATDLPCAHRIRTEWTPLMLGIGTDLLWNLGEHNGTLQWTGNFNGTGGKGCATVPSSSSLSVHHTDSSIEIEQSRVWW